jgi:hypothetical protein
MINLDLSKIVFIDAEIESGGQKILDIGAVKGNGWTFHSNSPEAFSDFLRGSEAVGGHNILNHDLKYLEKETEFKLRLRCLIGNAANFIQITTFHSYCFDLLGKVGNLEKSDQIIWQTIDRIKAGEVDLMRLTKTVLVIDEAQDMSQAEYALVRTLMEQNNDLRVIAVGDDDQNIYEFRGSSSKYFELLAGEAKAAKYELVDNYRSQANLVDFANRFAGMISLP